MKKLMKAQRGQFLVIAAFLVLTILTTAVVGAYNNIQDNSFAETVTLANEMNEINLSIKRVLGFTVGYYGSILQITGNVTYAREKTDTYIYSGLTSIAHSHVGWSPSFDIHSIDIETQWFGLVSWSRGEIALTYSVPELGLEGIEYVATSSLQVTMVDTINNQSVVSVKRDDNYPNLSLSKENFFFYVYDYETNHWNLVNPEMEPTISFDGEYTLDIPSGVDNDAYFMKVVDDRGIMVSSFYSPSGKSEYSYTFDWNSTLYQGLNRESMVVEFLQNGTLRWLGEKLDVGNGEKPIPPLLVKAIHVNQTIDGVNQEVPFQIEEWASAYTVPLGLTDNSSLISPRSIIVFLLNHRVSQTTIWWNSNDRETQTAYAWTNRYFQNDDPDSKILTNGELTLDFSVASKVDATTNGVTSESYFLRVNGRAPIYGSGLAYTIHQGIVRDVIQQEAEWAGGISDSPNIYSHIVITLPANVTYYTFTVRTIFLPSNKSRGLTDLSAIQLYADRGESLTEDGLMGGKPNPVTSPNEFYNGGTAWDHHWSEYLDANNKGAGIMFRNMTNTRLYAFDEFAGIETGALETFDSLLKIEMNPVTRYSVDDFQDAYDISWSGAVVTFGSGISEDTIFPYEDGYVYEEDVIYYGLWIIVEHPPTVLFG